MQIALLGPVEVRDDAGRPVDVAGARLQSLLARLALEAGRPVPVGTLVDAVWGESPPAEETNALQTLVSRLRRVLGAQAVLAAPGGYRLTVEAAQVDVHRFEQLAAEGARVLRGGDPGVAADLLRAALALWRGPLPEPVRGPAATRLDDLRLAALVDRIDADLALGDPAGLVPEVEALGAAHPLHERLAAQLVRALAEAGRPADALAAYERIRGRLADELGVDPSAELQELHLRLLRGEAEPPRPASSVRRTNLKAQLTSFVGREEEVSRIGKALERNRLVTLVGPGGAGKTRLAGEAAAGVLDREPDGVWFVELAPVGAGPDVAQAVLESLGLRDAVTIDRRKLPTGDAVSRLVDALGDKDLLLVLDNCEHVVEATAGLADHLLAQCPDLRVLATSREPLGIVGEVLLAVPPLGQPAPSAGAAEALEYPAVRLFADRASAALPDFAIDGRTVATVVEIVRRLDGLPLAIELAAARLRSLPLAEVSDRLSDRFRLLTGGSRTALPRHRTLRAVVEWSWELLPDDERLLVEQLAVFPSGVTVDSATAISDAAPEDVPDLLASLVDKSLLQRVGDGRRLRMLETIREYGVERLGERGELADVRGRYADHFATVMADAEPHLLQADQIPWFELLRAERENIVAALRHLCDVGSADRAQRLAVSLACYGMMVGLNDEVAAWIGSALEVPGGTDEDLRTVGEALYLLGQAGSAATAEAMESSLGRLRALTGRLERIRADVTPWLHVVRIGATFFSDERELCERYLQEAIDGPDPWARASGLMFRATLAENDGDVAGMRADCARARELFEALGERWGLGATLRMVAQLAVLDGELDVAATAYEQALALGEQLHSRDEEGWMLSRLADVELRRGNAAAARRLVERALAGADQRGSSMESLFALAMLAGVEQLSGDLDGARRHQRQAYDRLAAMPREHPAQGHIRAMVLSVSLRICAADGDLEEARSLAAQALDVALGTKDMPVVATVAVAFAELARSCGEPARAARLLGAADVVRGSADPTALDVVAVTRELRAALGDDAFEAAHADGAALDRDGAVASLRVP